LPKKFFDERRDQSEVKARIVQKYFFVWAKIVLAAAKKFGGDKIAYIDLYSGPGRYKDGAASTPLLVLEGSAADASLSQALVTIFNDENKDMSETLKNEIANVPGIGQLKYPPQIDSSAVGPEMEEALAKIRLVPTFTFFDPFGYKGLSQGIIQAVLKDWGCDCVFFFNYNRINVAIANELVEEHMSALFGEERLERLQEVLHAQRPHRREAIILEELANTLRELGAKFVLPFRFRNPADTRTSHFLIFLSKHKLGYGIMKEIMASESSLLDQGVPSFSYYPADETTPLLFSLSRPLDALEKDLLVRFSGQSLSMNDIYELHNIDTPYIKANYKSALLKLEERAAISCEPAKRRKGTFGDKVVATFPKVKK
jgi:three-Cys-motif partner protein